jgi:hypothetical protein
MPLGPVELLVVRFPGNQFSGEIVPALNDLVDSGTIRIIDLLFAMKNDEGVVGIFEFDEMGELMTSIFNPLVGEITGMLSREDAEAFANTLEPNSSVGLMLFENVWATRFAEAVRNANGQVVLSERLPRVVVEDITAAIAEA